MSHYYGSRPFLPTCTSTLWSTIEDGASVPLSGLRLIPTPPIKAHPTCAHGTAVPAHPNLPIYAHTCTRTYAPLAERRPRLRQVHVDHVPQGLGGEVRDAHGRHVPLQLCAAWNSVLVVWADSHRTITKGRTRGREASFLHPGMQRMNMRHRSVGRSGPFSNRTLTHSCEAA